MDGKEIVKSYLQFLRNKWRREAKNKEWNGELSVAPELNRRADALNVEIDNLDKEWDEFKEQLTDEYADE